MTIDDIYEAAVLIVDIINQNDRLKEENCRLKEDAEEHRKFVANCVNTQRSIAANTIKALINNKK